VQSSQFLFEARKITKRFGHFSALYSIDMQLRAGDFVTIFGANGAGKTTFLKIAATLMHPTEGTIYFHGKSIRDNGLSARSQIGYIAHNTFLYKNLTARENLRFYGKMYSCDGLDQLIEEKLDSVGLLKRADDPVRSFSRGMQQRLTIARAFLHNPSILLLDEPYTGLDAAASEILNHLLTGLNTEKCAWIMTTHNIDQGFDIATHVAILHKGRLKFFQSTGRIPKEEFKTKYLEIVHE